MISSNNLKIRNLSKKIDGFKGVLNKLESIPIDDSPFNMMEINVNVKKASTKAYLAVIKSGGTYVDVSRPQMYDSDLNPLYNFQFREVGFKKIYVDLRGYKDIRVHYNLYGESPGVVEIESNIVMYNESISNILKYKDGSSNNQLDRDVLFENNDFRFVKKADFKDSFNGWFLNFSSREVVLSDDLERPRKIVLDLNNLVVSAGNSEVLEAYIIPYDPEMKNTTKSFRVAVGLSNRDIYVNYYNGGGINDWGKSKWWEMRNTVRKIPVKTLGEAGGNKRFDPTLNNDRYNRNLEVTRNGATFIEYQQQPRLRWLGALCRTKKMVTFGTYLTTGIRIGNFITTDGGENWVLVYDFINRYVDASISINTSSFANYSGGLVLNKINIEYPSEANKEVISPFSYDEIPFSSISKGSTTVVTANSHGLVTGDMILFSGVGQDDNWSALKADSFGANGFTQNAYSVVKINDNTFEIKEYTGSYDTPLICRHIHSNNETLGGVIISTGEEYPNSWNLYLQQKQKDASYVVDAFNFTKDNVYRLNSSEKSPQRACGFLMGNQPDPKVIFNSDTSNGNLGSYEVDGRTSLPIKSSNGIYIGKLSDIDDWSKFECAVDIPEPAIWLYQFGTVIVGYYQLGGNVVSVDNGITWEYFPIGTSVINGVFKNNIVIGNGYVFEYK